MLIDKLLDLLALCLAAFSRRNSSIDSDKLSGHNVWSEEERRHHKKERIYWIISSITSGLALVSAIAGACFAFGAYRETMRQASIAQQSLDSSTRPWVLIESVTAAGPLVVQNGGANIPVKTIVKNYAQLPAIGVAFTATPLQVKPGFSLPEFETKTFCDKFSGPFGNEPSIVPPGGTLETRTTNIHVNLESSSYFPSLDPSRPIVQFRLIGCLNYTGLDGKSYQTTAYYRVFDSINSILFEANGTNVPAERLSFKIEGLFSNDDHLKLH